MSAWYVKKIVVPTIQGVSEAQECFVGQPLLSYDPFCGHLLQIEDVPVPAFARSCDEEAIALFPSMSWSFSSQQLLQSARFRPSVRGIQQVFRIVKVVFNNRAYENGDNISNPGSGKHIIKTPHQFEKDRSIDIGSESKGRICDGCVVIGHVMLEALAVRHIRHGFHDHKQFPLSLRTLMSQCFT
jgi:hypothetical protein